MMTPSKTKTPLMRVARFMWVSTILCFTFGVALGFSVDEFVLERFSSDQRAYIDGVVAGARFKLEYSDWKAMANPSESDMRSDPTRRCAALYFPNNDKAMDGCLQAVAGRPEGGYQIP